MKKPLTQTKVTVKLRKAAQNDRWYLMVEAYPVKDDSGKPRRIVVSVNRTITTPMFDKSSKTRSGEYKPKRDSNGVIMCHSIADRESCLYADNIRKQLQHKYDTESLFTDEEKERMEQKKRGQQDFIAYFKDITYAHHPNASRAIIINWERVGALLSIFSKDKPIPFNSISLKLLEDIKYFLLSAPRGGGKSGTISQNTASTYFAIVKAGLKQAFVDGYLTVDVSAKVKGISTEESRREALTIEEVNQLANTPCDDDVLKRASLFSILTGMRHSDIQQLRWKMLVRIDDSWRVDFTQIKTHGVEYMPISNQAYNLCGERRLPENLVFEGLKDPSWINRPLAKWIEAAGIKKHITFHCFRHSYATLLLTNGTSLETVSKMLGHTNIRTTQIYAKVVDRKKIEAANNIKIAGI